MMRCVMRVPMLLLAAGMLIAGCDPKAAKPAAVKEFEPRAELFSRHAGVG